MIHNLMSVVGDIINNFVNMPNAMGITKFVFWNIFGFISITSKLIEYQLKGRGITIIFSIIALTSWIFYFYLIGEIATTFSVMITAISCLVFLQRDKYKWARSPFWLYFFLACALVNAFINFHSWHDIFNISACVFGTLAYFVRSIKAYRHIALCAECSWLLNSLTKLTSTNPIHCLLCDILGCTSVLIVVARTYWFKKKADKTNEQVVEEKLAQ